MTGNFIDNLFDKAQNDSAFADFELVRAYESKSVKYPIKKPYVTFGTESSRTDTVLLGAENCKVFSETVIITVATDEKNGCTFCQESAKNVCAELMRLDSDKMITSVSVEKTVYDEKIFGYRTAVKFELSETAIFFGGE